MNEPVFAKLFATTLTELHPHHYGGSPYRHSLLKIKSQATDPRKGKHGGHQSEQDHHGQEKEKCFDLV